MPATARRKSRPRASSAPRRPQAKRKARRPTHNPVLLPILLTLVAAVLALWGWISWTTPRGGSLLHQLRTAAPVAASTRAAPADDAAIRYRYVPARAEPLALVAGRFNTSAARLKAINTLDGPTVAAGQAVQVPVRAIHRVAAGEGLNAIALRYKVRKADLIRANSLDGEVLRIDQQLIVPFPKPGA